MRKQVSFCLVEAGENKRNLFDTQRFERNSKRDHQQRQELKDFLLKPTKRLSNSSIQSLNSKSSFISFLSLESEDQLSDQQKIQRNETLKKHFRTLITMQKDCEDMLSEKLNSQVDGIARGLGTEVQSLISSISNNVVIAKNKEKIFKFIGVDKKVAILFGGQGYDTMKELKHILENIRNLDSSSKLDLSIENLFRKIIRRVEKILSLERDLGLKDSEFDFDHGFRITSWLDNCDDLEYRAGSLPNWYLFSAPISYPLTLIVQFFRYVFFLIENGLSHEEFKNSIAGGSGHSQGVTCALLISISKSMDDLFQFFFRFVRLSLYQGLRCHNALDVASNKDPNLSYKTFFRKNGDPLNKEEEFPELSPMMSVKGVEFSSLRKHLKEVNAEFICAKPAVQLGLINSPELFVVCGLPAALKMLKVSILESVEDVKKVNLMFLRSSSAFHSSLCEPAVELNMKDGVRLEIANIQPSDLAFPVIGSRVGANFAQFDCGKQSIILRRLLELQASEVLNFERTVNNLLGTIPAPEDSSPKVVIDFGPGDGTAKLFRNVYIERQQKSESLSNTSSKISVICTSGKLRSSKILDGSLIGIEKLNENK